MVSMSNSLHWAELLRSVPILLPDKGQVFNTTYADSTGSYMTPRGGLSCILQVLIDIYYMPGTCLVPEATEVMKIGREPVLVELRVYCYRQN